MCGLSFFCVKRSVSDANRQLETSLAVTKHRGPDASGTYFTTVADYQLGLGHNRLSILDLTAAGSQPMHAGNGVSIIFNGEVFNHHELRDDLVKKGYSFNGTSDTEVILKLYVEYKEHSFKKLQGMFSLVILDENARKFFLVRDVVGIKPVYYYSNTNGFYACSEIRGLKSYSEVVNEIDDNDVFEFFNNGFLYEPNTGYKKIKKVQPGTYIEFDMATGSSTTVRYQNIINFNTHQSVAETIESAVTRQLEADVPVGVFFSGGADSSILANYTGDADLFFAKYEETEDSAIDVQFSADIAKHLGKKLKITEILESNDNLLESIDFVAENTEELVSDYTFWATYRLSAEARKSGYTVMLSGMGGDEAFAGYPRYKVLKHHQLIRSVYPLLKSLLKLKLFPKKLDKKFERLVSYAQESYWPLAYSRMLGYFSKQELNQFFSNYRELEKTYRQRLDNVLAQYDGDVNDKVKCAQHFDMTGFLSHNLGVSDKASMLASIELRVPLLDERVVANGFATTSADLLKDGAPKAPLKALLKSLLPAALVNRPKTGFNPPLDGIILRLGADRLMSEFQRIYKFLNREEVERLVKSHFSGAANNTYKLWQLLYFERWLKFNFA
ncbi:asparagine synthase (glutamine-hydrolyzing) [Pseudomonas moorei]|uniref:asparagine synthase (glutamine-hydrolyzing) n=1 Tax=Pseudomonas moorei TaxID=395599 RepID=A0A1H0Z341_9PSED|nr:asparagine synthase (glutamine-hydrolyzing) [Pseudomonas moorei]KAB0498499.1 asparagine synthase (glutamine-hydrolyzing) [Pseudomonas moorei]SDQ21740.1 asparagine synthase (glutamine-hydrolysing) [Pseudomonas moorei]